MTDTEIQDYLKLAEGATAAPWYAVDSNPDEGEADVWAAPLCPHGYPDPSWKKHRTARGEHPCWSVGRLAGRPGWEVDCGCPGYGLCEHDAAFIAASRTAGPYLAGEVLRLRQECIALKDRVMLLEGIAAAARIEARADEPAVFRGRITVVEMAKEGV